MRRGVAVHEARCCCSWGASLTCFGSVPDSWLLHALDPSRPVVFLDTDQLPAPETRSDHLVSNEREALLVQQLTGAFLRGGVAATCIGVISPYRHQLKLITQMLRSLGQDIELNTVDKYQGRDKPCIVVSLVRSNDHAHVGDLLKDWRRVNVAVTRAKRKLVLIGSVKTLRGSLLLQELFDLLEARGWIHAIPKGAKCEFKLTEDSHPVLQEAWGNLYSFVSADVCINALSHLAQIYLWWDGFLGASRFRSTRVPFTGLGQ